MASLVSALTSPPRVVRVVKNLARTIASPSALPWRLRSSLHLAHALAWSHLTASGPRAALERLEGLARTLPALAGESSIEAAFAELEAFGTCLTRSVAIAMMARDVDLVIGVRRESPNTLDAHAWLERNGRVLAGSESRGEVLARVRFGSE